MKNHDGREAVEGKQEIIMNFYVTCWRWMEDKSDIKAMLAINGNKQRHHKNHNIN